MGDMPNILLGADGSGTLEYTIPGAKLTSGDAPLLDADGAAIVIHAAADDMKTDPTGNAGGRLGVRGKVWMRNAGVAGLYTEVDFDTTYESSTGTYVRTWGSAKRTLAQDTDAVRFIQSAGTISGTFRMWGHTKG